MHVRTDGRTSQKHNATIKQLHIFVMYGAYHTVSDIVEQRLSNLANMYLHVSVCTELYCSVLPPL